MSTFFYSIGIDIGTTTTQLVISKIHYKAKATNFSVPEHEITNKECIYKSHIYRTPLDANQVINSKKIRDILIKEYEKAGISKEELSTGAVIITGETARRSNAKEVLEDISDFAGDFVVATAGAGLESVISGIGSGAKAYSQSHSSMVINIDIGGGTSNISVFYQGELIDKDCVNVGGALIRFSTKSNQVCKIEETIYKDYKTAYGIKVGTKDSDPKLDILMYEMVDKLVSTIKKIKNRLPIQEKVSLSYSGGVGAYIYGQSNAKIPDIGRRLAEMLKINKDLSYYPLVRSKETIRATVIGAGQHIVNVSGSTIFKQTLTLPIKNLPILCFQWPLMKKTIEEHIREMMKDNIQQDFACFFQCPQKLSFQNIQDFTNELIKGYKPWIQEGFPMVIILNQDYAKILGQTLAINLPEGYPILCIDQIQCGEHSYIDIGKTIGTRDLLPVMVKTLLWDQ